MATPQPRKNSRAATAIPTKTALASASISSPPTSASTIVVPTPADALDESEIGLLLHQVCVFSRHQQSLGQTGWLNRLGAEGAGQQILDELVRRKLLAQDGSRYMPTPIGFALVESVGSA